MGNFRFSGVNHQFCLHFSLSVLSTELCKQLIFLVAWGMNSNMPSTNRSAQIYTFIIIISCYPLQGHRASTKRRHLILFLASFLTSPQLFPSSNASLWTDLLHVCLGLPLLRFPCGFQSKASFSMASFPFLNVCPTQFHFRLLICTDISISSALLQSSSFEITSGQ